MVSKVVQAIGLFVVCLGLLFLIHSRISSKQVPSVSFFPLPSYLRLTTNPTVSSLFLWFPQTRALATGNINLTAQSALVYDMSTNQMIYEKNPTDRHPMASLTKIMTAIVSLEHPRSDDAYTASASDLVGEDSMGIDAGEQFTQKELLYGLFLKSGNDAAEVLARNSVFGRDGFIIAMNNKAESLRLTDTHFTNPTGLEGDGDQYTTSQDLLIMTRFALTQFPLFDTVAGTYTIDLPANANHKEFYLENETNLLSSYPGVKGIKTGYTPEAGNCLVTYLDYKGHKMIAIILNSDNRRQEMKDLLDYSLKSVGVIPPRHG